MSQVEQFQTKKRIYTVERPPTRSGLPTDYVSLDYLNQPGYVQPTQSLVDTGISDPNQAFANGFRRRQWLGTQPTGVSVNLGGPVSVLPGGNDPFSMVGPKDNQANASTRLVSSKKIPKQGGGFWSTALSVVGGVAGNILLPGVGGAAGAALGGAIGSSLDS